MLLQLTVHGPLPPLPIAHRPRPIAVAHGPWPVARGPWPMACGPWHVACSVWCVSWGCGPMGFVGLWAYYLLQCHRCARCPAAEVPQLAAVAWQTSREKKSGMAVLGCNETARAVDGLKPTTASKLPAIGVRRVMPSRSPKAISLFYGDYLRAPVPMCRSLLLFYLFYGITCERQYRCVIIIMIITCERQYRCVAHGRAATDVQVLSQRSINRSTPSAIIGQPCECSTPSAIIGHPCECSSPECGIVNPPSSLPAVCGSMLRRRQLLRPSAAASRPV